MMTRQFGHLSVAQIPCLTDNYAFVLRDETTGATAAVDTPDPDMIAQYLLSRGWGLDYIFNTHWHADHTGGNLALKERFAAQIVGPMDEGDRIPGRDRPVRDGDQVALGGLTAMVLATPGHTKGHIVYLFPDQQVAFVGDTLFSLGCGRLFEGTPQQMWHSLERLRALPSQTTVFCAHEYTQANARFARHLDPDNKALGRRTEAINTQRAKGLPTVPFQLGEEIDTNPFLRADNKELATAVGLPDAPPEAVFAAIRTQKDSFQ